METETGKIDSNLQTDNDESDWIWVQRPNPNISQAVTSPAHSCRQDIALSEWMKHISSDSYLSELSIAGSHESCAKVPIPWVQCQRLEIEEQLNAGVRYFDFRLGIDFGTLRLYHGPSPLGYELSKVLQRIYKWLKLHASEALMLQVKHEGRDSDQAGFETLFRLEIEANPQFWKRGNRVPKLGAVRGQIQLIRRFDIASGILGIDVGKWADNSARFTISIQPSDMEKLVVQDEYDYTNKFQGFLELIDTKSMTIEKLMDEAREDQSPRTWYLNWCNASAGPFSLRAIATPKDMAIGRDGMIGVNETIYAARLSRPRKARVGTLLLDYIGSAALQLVPSIVMTNDFVEDNN